MINTTSAAASQGDVDKNCGAFTTDDKDYSEDGSQWRIFSYQQLYDLQTNSIGFKSLLDLSFKLECPGFNRDNGALDKWKTAPYKKELPDHSDLVWRNVTKQTRVKDQTNIMVVFHLSIHIFSMKSNIRV